MNADLKAKLTRAVAGDLRSILLINEKKVAATFLILEKEHEMKRTRMSAACAGLGKVGLSLALYKMNPDICLSRFSNVTYPIHWTKLSGDYMEYILQNFRTPAGGTAIYKAVTNFLAEFQRKAEAIRPWLIFIFTDGFDEHSTNQEKALALTQLTLLHNIPGVRVQVNFLTMGDSQADNMLFARAGCLVTGLPNPLQMGVIIAAELKHYGSRPWPDIGILVDTSGSMENTM